MKLSIAHAVDNVQKLVFNMKPDISRTAMLSTLLLLIMFGSMSMSSASGVLQSSNSVSSIGSIRYSYDPPVTPPTKARFGFSCYPKEYSSVYSTAAIDSMISMMNRNGFDIYRMEIYYTQSKALRDEMVRYFLEHCNYDLVACRMVYKPGEPYLGPDLANVKAWVLDLLATFSSYQNRLWVEPINEAGDSKLSTYIQDIVTATRSAGYTANLVFNKWKQSWSSMASVNDPLNRTYFGYHFYFNSWGVSGAKSEMQTALNLGLKIINTEIGADYRTYASQYDKSEVVEVNDFCAWCKSNEITNTVFTLWVLGGMFETYKRLGLINPLTGKTVT